MLCSHALKILDKMNIKLLPNHYVLKRWTKEELYKIASTLEGTCWSMLNVSWTGFNFYLFPLIPSLAHGASRG